MVTSSYKSDFCKKKKINIDFSQNDYPPDFTLYENLSSPIVIITPRLIIEYINSSAEEFYNVNREKIIGKNCCKEFDCSTIREFNKCPVPEIIENGNPVDIKLPHHMGCVDSYVRVFPVFTGNKITGVGFEDFSKFANIKTEAEKLEYRFSKIVGIAAFAVFVLGEKFVIEFANNAAVEMIGEDLETLEGSDFRDYLNDKEVIQFLEDMYSGENTIESVCFYSDKSVFFGKKNLNVVELCLTKAKEKEDQEKIYIYLRNITKEIQLQDDLKQTNEFLKNLINQSADGIIAADTKGNIIIFNESAEKLLGFSSNEAINHIHITDIYRNGYAKEVMKMLRSRDYGGVGRVQSIEAIIINKSGEEIPCSLSAAIIYDKNGAEVATVGIFSDLRAKKRMQKKLEETQMKLFQSEKMSSLGKLAAGIAHEINNPLGGIMIFANMLLEEFDENDKRREDIDRIASEAKRCKNIVKGLLEFSRQTGNMMTRVNINELLEQGITLLENQAIFHNIKIVKDYDPQLPPVKCDSARIKQVFINITQNALDAMGEKGTFTIHTHYNRTKNIAEIDISDTGEGIPEDVKPNIFDPFFTTKEVGKGTGLGLSMSYGIINDHGGTISFKSKVGKGTTFIIELPIDGKK